jgi:hypothetical protein
MLSSFLLFHRIIKQENKQTEVCILKKKMSSLPARICPKCKKDKKELTADCMHPFHQVCIEEIIPINQKTNNRVSGQNMTFSNVLTNNRIRASTAAPRRDSSPNKAIPNVSYNH